MKEFYNQKFSTIDPHDILSRCTKLEMTDPLYGKLEVIQQIGSPNQILNLFDDPSEISENSPIILPIFNIYSELLQCVKLQKGKQIDLSPEGYINGFAYSGKLEKDQPVVITYCFETFFKISQTSFTVVLVIPQSFNTDVRDLKKYEIEKIDNVIGQLTQAGYKKLYLPVRPEYKFKFSKLEQNTDVRLLVPYENGFDCDLTQYASLGEVECFLYNSINNLSDQGILSKGHIAKPMKWENGLFYIRKDGVFFLDNNNKDDNYKYICSPILVKAHTRDTSSNNWGILLDWHDLNHVNHSQAFSKELFQTDGADLRKLLANKGVSIATDKRGRELFQCYLGNYQTERYALCVNRVGWNDECYVLPHKTFGVSQDLIVYQATVGLDNRYKSKGTLDQWREQVSRCIEPHSYLVFALCTAFSGQVIAPLNQKGFGFHFKGASSKGKSTALNLACSVWGNPNDFNCSWKSTGNALEHTAYMHNDGLLALDEIGEIADAKELGDIIYMLANGAGKSRMNKKLTTESSRIWNLIFLSSGEKSLKEIMREQGQEVKLGQEIRLAEIDIDCSHYGIFSTIDFAEDATKQAVDLKKRITQNYGVAGDAWLEYLTNEHLERFKELNDFLEIHRPLFTNKSKKGHIQRVANNFALVAAAGEVATIAGITGWKEGTALNAVLEVFDRWLYHFEYDSRTEIKEIFTRLKLMLSESVGFEKVDSAHTKNERVSNKLGYHKIHDGEKVFCILPEDFDNKFCKGLITRRVLELLSEYNFLICDSGKKHLKTIRLPNINDKTTKMYVIKASILNWNPPESESDIGNLGNSIENEQL